MKAWVMFILVLVAIKSAKPKCPKPEELPVLLESKKYLCAVVYSVSTT